MVDSYKVEARDANHAKELVRAAVQARADLSQGLPGQRKTYVQGVSYIGMDRTVTELPS